MNPAQYLLCKLAEEAAEVAQIALKAQQFGLHERQHPSGPTNADRIRAELNDMAGVIQMICDDIGIDLRLDASAARAKIEKVRKYRAYSVNLNLVQA